MDWTAPECLITRYLGTEQFHGCGGFKCVLQEYQRCFHKTKEKLEQTPNERQFDFSEMYIFGKFDTFQRRLNKILEMFCTITTYSALQDSKIEGLETMATRFQVGVLWPGQVCTLVFPMGTEAQNVGSMVEAKNNNKTEWLKWKRNTDTKSCNRYVCISIFLILCYLFFLIIYLLICHYYAETLFWENTYSGIF